ncbi:MAG: hypothetical protein BRD29_01975 [Bacteroidetes bacterium QH_2_67_10]|nr:MAG: hypothetical protein BRD29_01975 [Bacteroidetes bacterium QH_2_67_10]
MPLGFLVRQARKAPSRHTHTPWPRPTDLRLQRCFWARSLLAWPPAALRKATPRPTARPPRRPPLLAVRPPPAPPPPGLRLQPIRRRRPGNVGTREQGRTAAEVAAGVDGVDDVLNRLTVSGQRVAWNEGADDESDGSSASGSRQPVAAAEQQQKQGTAGAGGDATAGGGTYHTVKAGESLWAIASEYGTSVSRVKELNNLRSNSLQAGERLLVEEGGGASSDGASSDGATAADASGAQQESDASSSSEGEEEEAADGEKTSAYYVVKRGDSLWGIAQKNGLSVAKLKELNELSSSDLMPGDRLRVE